MTNLPDHSLALLVRALRQATTRSLDRFGEVRDYVTAPLILEVHGAPFETLAVLEEVARRLEAPR